MVIHCANKKKKEMHQLLLERTEGKMAEYCVPKEYRKKNIQKT